MVAAALISVAGVSSAATVNLTTGSVVLTGNGAATGTFDQGGISGTILAGCSLNSGGQLSGNCNGVNASRTPVLNITNDGLGVVSRNDQTDALDSDNFGELVTFTFDSAVTMMGVVFSSLGSTDQYRLIIGGTTVEGTGPGNWTGSIANILTMTVVALSGEFRVSSFEATAYVAPPQPPVVPLPAAGWVMVAGLGALGAMRRRKSKIVA